MRTLTMRKDILCPANIYNIYKKYLCIHLDEDAA
jgi:hypothetical protein